MSGGLTFAVLLLANACASLSSPEPDELIQRVDRLLTEHRPFLFHIGSVSTEPCNLGDTTGPQLVQPVVCHTGDREGRLLGELARLAPALRGFNTPNPSVQLRRAILLLDLVAGRNDPAVLMRAAEGLRGLGQGTSGDTRILAEAAGAYLASAAAGHGPESALMALDLIERASDADSLDPVVGFNRAVVLQRLYLVGEAADAWPSWARASSASVRNGADSMPLPSEPESIREQVLDQLLPAWGTAILEAQLDSAATLLRRAGELGAGIAAQRGDSSVAAAVAELTESRGDRRLAAGAAAYGQARRLFDQGSFEAALPHFVAARSAFGSSSAALWGWAQLHLAVIRLYQNDYRGADRLFAEILDRVSDSAWLGLRARTLWAAGLSLARQDQVRLALERFDTAAGLFRQAGEQSNLGGIEWLASDMHALAGDLPSAHAAQLRSARAYTTRRDLGTLQSFLETWGAYELRAGRTFGARAILREAVRVARRTGRPKDPPEALARLASAEILMGKPADASAHLREARSLLPSIPSQLMRDAEEAEISRVEARLLTGAEAVTKLDGVARYYERLGVPYDLAPTLVHRADARLSIHDTTGAERDLDSALALVTRRAGRLDALAAASAREVEQTVFQRRVAIRLKRSGGDEALAEIDGQRSWHIGRDGPISSLPSRVDSGQAIIAWALLPGQLVRWTISSSGIQTALTPLREKLLAEMVSRFTAAVRRGEDTMFIRREGEILHGLLFSGPAVQPGTRLALIVDPALSALPFVALRDVNTGRLLIQDHEIQFAFGVREAVDGLARTTTLTEPRLTLAGDFAAAGLPRLSQSGTELDSIGVLYPGARVLRGDSVTRVGVTTGLRYGSVFHFSGHALTAPAGRLGSRLVLAGTGALESGEISRLDLRHLRLVVLSACETLTLLEAGSYRMDGLAEAFLAAGAGAVVGSSWPVEDATTASLMTEMYRNLKQGQRIPAALRAAQLRSLESGGDPGRSLRTWAAFRYLTR